MSFDKIRHVLGFEASHSINDGIDEVRALIEKDRLDWTDVRYSNLAWLKQNGFSGLGRGCLDEPADPSDPIEQVA